MTMQDILTLAKAGYTAEQISALAAAEQTQPQEQEQPQEQKPKQKPKQPKQKQKPEPDQEQPQPQEDLPAFLSLTSFTTASVTASMSTRQITMFARFCIIQSSMTFPPFV